MKNMFYEDCGANPNKLCVRRVGGMLGLIASITGMFMKLDASVIQTLMILSGALLGITTIDKFGKNSCSI